MELLAIALFVSAVLSVGWTQLFGAPWVPSSKSTVRAMLRLAEVQPGDVIYDLGCGDGRVVLIAARECGAIAVGIEVDPLRYLICRARIAVSRVRDRITIRFGDFFSQDLSQADVVACYLLQETNEQLLAKLREELRPGTRIVSNTFGFPGLESAGREGRARLYLI